MIEDDVIRVFVGADRSQKLAIDVLAYSIRQNTSAAVEVVPMVDLEVPLPRDPRNWQRTGFSFSRFCIPKLAGYAGRALYMDADMQVFKDIRELWSLPFDGRKILVQEAVEQTQTSLRKDNAPAVRKKQCAVMLLDCSRLDWDVSQIVGDLDQGAYSYAELMESMCILPEEDVGYTVPFRWNSLEHFDETTGLLHYTDMGTQPWVSVRNPNGGRWFETVRAMLADGSLTWADIALEVKLGYFRPSIVRDIRYSHLIPSWARAWLDRFNEATDRAAGYVPHAAVYASKKKRVAAVRESEARAQEPKGELN